MKKQYKIDVLPISNNIKYDQRENGITQSAFELEYNLFNCIKNGKYKQMSEVIEDYLNRGVVVGRLSIDKTRQIRYWAVSSISLAVHYAILGGMDETDAFNFSDDCIMHIDMMKDADEIITYLSERACKLAEFVYRASTDMHYSPLVKNAIHYINIHLHDRLLIADIAKQLGISRDYLSSVFRKETSISIHSYILKEKLEASKEMLQKDYSYDAISYNLSFCSESHYISCFKKEYGITPGEYKKQKWSIK